MKKAVSSEVMRESDAYACENTSDSKTLMFMAGKGIFESFDFSGKTAVVCGSGNNAGDGFVLARLICESGGEAEIFLLSDKFSESGRYYFDECVSLGIKTQKCSEDTDFSGFDNIADCIFGTGFRGSVSGLAALIIDKINASGKKVVSADINSGLSADSGISDRCVVSDLTVSIGDYKYGHFLGMAKDVMRNKKNIDIGIEIRGRYARLCEKEDFLPLIRERKNHSNKGNYGYVGIMGGCTEYSGAVKLANLAVGALRGGCGVVKLIVAESLAPAMAPYMLESTLYPVPDKYGYMVFSKEAIDRALTGLAALSVGMGWSVTSETKKILEYILTEKSVPLIIDADGINTLAQMDIGLLRKTKCRVTLTPHPKEFERISGIPVKEILADPVKHAENFAREYGVILLLKGASTVITDGEETYITDRGCAGMATAGSGDVLSGLLTGLFGYMGYSPLTVALGAYMAGAAGEYAERENTAFGMTSGDTARRLPKVWREILDSMR